MIFLNIFLISFFQVSDYHYLHTSASLSAASLNSLSVMVAYPSNMVGRRPGAVASMLYSDNGYTRMLSASAGG